MSPDPVGAGLVDRLKPVEPSTITDLTPNPVAVHETSVPQAPVDTAALTPAQQKVQKVKQDLATLDETLSQIRERTREVAVLKTLGFTRRGVLALFVSEAVALSLIGGLIGASFGALMVYGFSHAAQMTFFPLRMTPTIFTAALLASGLVGFFSSALPSYRASQINIVDGLRHTG